MSDSIVIAALYHFTKTPLLQRMNKRIALLHSMKSTGVKGTLLLAEEGINGTIAGTRAAIDAVLAQVRTWPCCKDLTWKESTAAKNPFLRSKIKLKREIVTMGHEEIKPAKHSGVHVDAKQWQELLADPDTVVIDARNGYEVGIGKFKGAIDPETDTFRQFPEFVDKQMQPNKQKKIAMYCTGGIRCEKASAYMLQQGFEQVYQLKGGILQYFADTKADESYWQGECFVFDERVAVDRNLSPGSYTQCYACRMPLTDAETLNASYKKGISCLHCEHKTSAAQKQSFAQRQQQIDLSKQKGEQHLGEKAVVA